jgi:hypothetical protein
MAEDADARWRAQARNKRRALRVGEGNLGVNRSNFDTGWDWAIWDMKREDWYDPLPRKSKRKRPS